MPVSGAHDENSALFSGPDYSSDLGLMASPTALSSFTPGADFSWPGLLLPCPGPPWPLDCELQEGRVVYDSPLIP